MRREVFLIFKEALHNIVAARQATEVAIDVAIAAASQLIVQDDGCGFDAARVQDGQGLRSMRAAGGEPGGTLEVSSARRHGRRLALTVPL